MKIRSNFVSNSSSSSFIIYGKKIDFYDINQEDLLDATKNKIICVLDGQGTSGECENFVFTVTPARIKLLQKNKIPFENGEFYEVIKQWKDDEEIINITEPLTGGRLYTIVKDYSSPATDSERNPDFLKWVIGVQDYTKQTYEGITL